MTITAIRQNFSWICRPDLNLIKSFGLWCSVTLKTPRKHIIHALNLSSIHSIACAIFYACKELLLHALAFSLIPDIGVFGTAQYLTIHIASGCIHNKLTKYLFTQSESKEGGVIYKYLLNWLKHYDIPNAHSFLSVTTNACSLGLHLYLFTLPISSTWNMYKISMFSGILSPNGWGWVQTIEHALDKPTFYDY